MKNPSPYRFERLKLGHIMRDMLFTKNDPGPGDTVDFDLLLLDGDRFRSADLEADRPALLIFGSYTCPVTASAIPGLNELHSQFRDDVRFVMVNVREAHPGEIIPQPEELDEKRENAQRLKDLRHIPYEVAVDDIDGTLHRALSPKPNSAYLLGQNGNILFRAHWANDTKGIKRALEAVTSGRPLKRTKSRGIIRPMWPTMRYISPVLEEAGKGAWRDMWRAVPPMAAMAYMMRLVRLTSKSA